MDDKRDDAVIAPRGAQPGDPGVPFCIGSSSDAVGDSYVEYLSVETISAIPSYISRTLCAVRVQSG
jgi:hypothetical protein